MDNHSFGKQNKPIRHAMQLQPQPFHAMQKGRKTVEMRLWDEKRRLIRVGDEIEFSLMKDKNTSFAVRVVSLAVFPDFAALYAAYPPSALGYDRKSEQSASPDDMLAYYSREEMEKWGVVAIGVERIEGGAQTLTPASRHLAFLLRHHPEAAGLTLDAHGWAETEKVVSGIGKKFPGFTRSDLEKLVENDAKQRYTFSEDHSRIRAAQGHSVSVDVEPEEREPPRFLLHGTSREALAKIFASGLQPRGRQFVHLTEDARTAEQSGARHGTPVVLRVDAEEMRREGFRFYRAENGVWLTKFVPPSCLSEYPVP